MRALKISAAIAVIASLALISCNKTSRSNQLSYWETQCSNPWVNYADEVQHKSNVLVYLNSHGVNATDIELEMVNDSAAACAACTCPSGMRVDIWVEDEDVAEANALGFH